MPLLLVDNEVNKTVEVLLNKLNRTTNKYNTVMNNKIILGAIAGDVIGSAYEFAPVKNLDFQLFWGNSRSRFGSTFTDDSVMTVAVADWLLHGGSLVSVMQFYGREYPNAGYGGMFSGWLIDNNAQPYNSYGNGAGMRVSPVGWAFDTLEETLDAAEESAAITHNHPEGIKGAQAIASCIYLARTGRSKEEIKDYITGRFNYDLNRTCDAIRPGYSFDVTCQGSVPESIICFLESTDYESAVRLAVSLGGDADTMGAMAGGIAEAFYGGVPELIRAMTLGRIPDDFMEILYALGEKYNIDV